MDNNVRISIGQGVATTQEVLRNDSVRDFGVPIVDYSKEFGLKMTDALLKTYEIHNKLDLEPPKELLELAQQGIEMNRQGLPIPLEMVAKIDSLAFNDKQIEQIEMGLAHGLTKRDVSVYADPKIKAEKMEDWRKGLEKINPWKNKVQDEKHVEKTKEKVEDLTR